MKARLTNADRAKVRGTLAQYLVNMGLDDDTAVAAVTRGSPSMADAVGRRIARCPGYAQTHTVTPEMFNLAFAEWIAYKCGIRDEVAEATPKTPRDVLSANGATDIEYYSLVNNFGYTFTLGGKHYDARFWANCYGTALDRWEVACMDKREDEPQFTQTVDPELKARLESALNATRAA